MSARSGSWPQVRAHAKHGNKASVPCSTVAGRMDR
jgi:hypothetical protein